VAGNLVVGGTITGSIKIDTIHVSQITGLLGEGFTMSFPDILNNYASLEIPGILTFNEKVVIISGPGSETERISVPLTPDHYREQAGVTMEYPLVFETGNSEDVNNLKIWFDNPSASEEEAALIIRNLAGTETSRWVFTEYIPDGYEAGYDGRTMSCPAVEIDYENRTVTLTFDYQEGYQIYNWVKSTILGENWDCSFSIIETVDGINEISRRNYFESLPVKYEQFYGFGQDTKLKARVVIAFGYWENA
jgi:hypothetical protein